MSNKNPDNSSENPHARVSRAEQIYYLVTAAVCGAIVMMLEVLGSRVVGPFFGVSLFVWTSLITVTLLALALGYAVGGRLADRFHQPHYLYALILLSALFCLLIAPSKVWVLKACLSLGLRSGAFVSALLLFGPCLFLLGCVSPYLVKLSARQWRHVGKTVGSLYALSTLGSTLGSVFTGFWMVGYLGSNKSLYAIGVILMLLALGYFLLFHRRWKPLLGAALLLLLATVSFPDEQAYAKRLAGGTELRKIDQLENYYGSIKILESKSESGTARYLLLDNMIQGGIDVDNGMSIFPYSYHMQFLGMAHNPNGSRCLGIGLGVGVVLKWIEQHGKVCDVVDINPAIFEMAKRYFAYTPKGQRFVQDGRYFLEQNSQRYDYIFLDVFSGELTPAHLLSREAMQAIDKKMNPGAVLTINLISRLEGDSATASVVKTLQSVFDHVAVYPVFDVERENVNEKIGNIILLAYQGKAREADYSAFNGQDIHYFYRTKILNLLGKKYHLRTTASALLLSDDYNPVDYIDAESREKIRWDVLKGIDLDFQLL